ncbi:prepilin peptidase [Patescibacteria group bacterium]
MLQQTMLYILTFISGLFFGSFLNLVSDRVVKGEKILIGRSKCDHCKKNLRPTNLIPLVSYVLQRGKCAFCNKKLSLYYPFSEILTGLMLVGVAYFTHVFTRGSIPGFVSFIYMAVVGSFYIVIFLADLKYKLIPNKVVIPAIIFVIIFIVINTAVFFYFYHQQLKASQMGIYLLEAGFLKLQFYSALKNIAYYFISALGIALFFYFLVFITKEKGMGGGDVKLGFLIGLFNGFPLNIVAIFSGFLLGASISLVLVLLRIRSLKDTVPFGPFLIIGSVIALVWGSRIWEFYINLF